MLSYSLLCRIKKSFRCAKEGFGILVQILRLFITHLSDTIDESRRDFKVQITCENDVMRILGKAKDKTICRDKKLMTIKTNVGCKSKSIG